jgi:hypothetical protein
VEREKVEREVVHTVCVRARVYDLYMYSIQEEGGKREREIISTDYVHLHTFIHVYTHECVRARGSERERESDEARQRERASERE